MFQLEGDVFVADGADQEAVGGVILRRENVEAHDAAATYRDPKIWSLRRVQSSPPTTECGGIIHRKTGRLGSGGLRSRNRVAMDEGTQSLRKGTADSEWKYVAYRDLARSHATLRGLGCVILARAGA